MNLDFTAQDETFRRQVREFLRQKLPPELAAKVGEGEHLTRAEHAAWHAALNEQGWLASHWPVEHGGPGWNVVQRYIFEYECAMADAPRIVPFGVHMLAQVLIRYGNEAQKRWWLPRMLDGQDWWCQGYSEPDAGSDLAALKTTAVRDGNCYVVNGQKTWTTLAHFANMIFCLVRTDRSAKAQSGISFLMIDMRTPGVEVRPIITLEGAHDVNDVFFTDVRVPVENLVGQENKGWDCAKYLLTFERTNIAGVGFATASLERARRLAKQRFVNGKALADSPMFALRLAKAEIDLANLQTTNLRVLSAAAAGACMSAESSLLKIRGSELRQEMFALARRAMGAQAQTPDASGIEAQPVGGRLAAANYFTNRKLSIFGGSNEVQKNIISKSMLGL